MTLTIILACTAVIICIGWVIVEIRKISTQTKEKLYFDQANVLIEKNLTAIRDTLSLQLEFIRKQMSDSGSAMQERLQSASTMFGEIKHGMGELKGVSEQMLSVGKDMTSLQELLRSPKLRGSLSEYFLGQIVRQMLPPEYFVEQYRFSSGEIVDLVVRMGDKLLSIDAKFPLENFKLMIEAPHEEQKNTYRKAFRADVKKHLDAIAQKYIVPAEGTFDFAFMYIPAENVFYEIITDTEVYAGLLDYALEKKVFPVSPATFCAYLHIIILGLKGFAVEKNAEHILQYLTQLKNDLNRFADDFLLLGRHLSNTRSKYEDAEKKLTRLSEKIGSLEKVEK